MNDGLISLRCMIFMLRNKETLKMIFVNKNFTLIERFAP